MSRNRNYKSGTRAALNVFSRGTCYWPGCVVPLIRLIEGKPRINLQIAHIFGLNEGSRRHDPSLTEDELNDFSNLIYLCKPHHEAVDEDADRYPIDVLFRWKNQREQDSLDALDGIHSLATQEGLRKAIAEAIADQDRAVEDTLARLERNDSAAAQLLRDLRDELATLNRARLVVDPDVASALSRATEKLGKQLNPDTVSALSRAVNDLNLDPDVVSLLARSAEKLQNLPSMTEMLLNAAKQLRASNPYM